MSKYITNLYHRPCLFAGLAFFTAFLIYSLYSLIQVQRIDWLHTLFVAGAFCLTAFLVRALQQKYAHSSGRSRKRYVDILLFLLYLYLLILARLLMF